MLKRIITTTTPAVICSAIFGVQAGEQIVPVNDRSIMTARGGAAPQNDFWELNEIRRPDRLRIHEEAEEVLARDRERMQEIATGLEVSIKADEDNKHRIVLRDGSGKKIAEASGTAEEVEVLKTMKTNEERAMIMQMKELVEAGKKAGLSG